LTRRGRILLIAVCSLMFATIGASGVAAARPAVPTTSGSSSAVQVNSTAPAATNNAPSALPSGKPDCFTPGQATLAGSSGRQAITPPLQLGGPVLTAKGAASTTGAVVPRPCDQSKPAVTTADLAAAAARARASSVKPAKHAVPTATTPNALRKDPASRRPTPQSHTPSAARPSSATTTAAPDSAPMHIKGTVTDAVTTDAISGIEVDVLDMYGDLYDSAHTNSSGMYSIVVDPDDYNVFFYDSNELYASGYYGVGGAFTYDWESAATVTVSSGDQTADMALPAAVHIVGTVTNTSAHTLAGIDIDVLDSDGYAVNSKTTDGDGKYSAAVPPGTYTLAVTDGTDLYASGYYNSGTGFTYFPDQATTVIVGSGGDTTVDEMLPLAVHITGKVTRNGVAGLADITVYADGSSYSNYGYTDGSGNYSLAVAPGSYTVSFEDDSGTYAFGYYSTTTTPHFVYDASAASAVAVSSSGDETANVTLPLAVYITGTISDASADPVPDIEVDVYATAGSAVSPATGADASAMPAGTIYDYTYTDDAGYYEIEVAPGSYTIRFLDGSGVYASGFYSSSATSHFVYTSNLATVVVVSASGDVIANASLPVAINIKGKVTKSGGVGIGDIAVFAFYLDGSIYNSNFTDSTGAYSIPVTTGVYEVGFYDESGHYGAGYYSTAGFTYYWTAASSLTVAGPPDLTGKNVTLPVAVHIKGTVTNAASTALPGIMVDADNNSYGNGATTDSSGNYSIAVAPGTYVVSTEDSGTYAHGYYTVSSPSGFTYDPSAATGVAVASTDVTGKNMSLPLDVFVQGTVTDAAADPLSDIEVDVLTTADDLYDATTTDENGNYEVAVAPGSYAIEVYDGSGVYPRGYYNDSTSFTFDWSQATAVNVSSGGATADVTLQAAAHVTGRVFASGSVGLPDITVTASGAGYYNYVTTDGNGNYSIAVAPGTYTLSLYDPYATYGSGYYTTSTSSNFTYDVDEASTVDVSSSDVTGKNVQLPLALLISGTVTTTAGAPLADLEVDATGQTYSNYSYTDDNGDYSIAVAPDTYTISVTDSSGTYGSGFYTTKTTSGFTYDPSLASHLVVNSASLGDENLSLPLAVHIRGKVSKTGGTGLSDIEVYAGSTGVGQGPHGWTAGDGTYSIAVAPGGYTLWFDDPAGIYVSGYYSTAGFAYASTSASTVTVSSANVTGKNVTLPVAAHIKGQVTRSGGAPLAGIDVFAARTGIVYSATTDAGGDYSVPVSAGGYTLSFTDETGTYASGYYSSTSGFVYSAKSASTVTVAATDVTGKNVVLPKALRIEGTVTDAGDAALAGIEVDASTADGAYAIGGSTGTDGTYSLEVAPGTYTLWFRDHSGVDGAGYYSLSALVDDLSSATPVPVSTASVTDINVKMQPAAGLVFPSSTYTAVAPARVLDTRPTGSGHTNMGLSGKFTAGEPRTFGVADVPFVGGLTQNGMFQVAAPWNATAVTGNLTIVGETAGGLIALGPTMAPTGDVTTINFAKGDTRANNVTVGLDPDGNLSAVFRSATVGATVDLIFDVTGYFTPDTMGATYHALAPGRVLDTRKTGSGHTNIGLAGKFVTKTVRTFSVAGVKGLGWSSALVPSNAAAVTGNLTITNATSVGYVSVGPTVAAVPSTSTLNVAKGANVANGVTVALKAGKLQAVWDGTAGSSADVIFDITGYFTPDTTGLAFHPIVPDRLLDTTTGKGLVGVFTSLTSRPLAIGGVDAIPADAAGISGNLTVVNPSSNGFAFISPAVVTSPTSSTLNAVATKSIANGFDVALQGGGLYLIWCGTAGSTADLQLDVTGYWK